MARDRVRVTSCARHIAARRQTAARRTAFHRRCAQPHSPYASLPAKANARASDPRWQVDQTYLATHRSNERCRIRRRQQGANVSFQHQLWITETKEDGSTETTLMERTLSAREYWIILKQADPRRCTVSKTLTWYVHALPRPSVPFRALS